MTRSYQTGVNAGFLVSDPGGGQPAAPRRPGRLDLRVRLTARTGPESAARRRGTFHALVTAAHSHVARGPRRRRCRQPPAAAAGRVHPPADGRPLLAAPARPAGPPEGHRGDPRGDEPDRRAGVPDAID